MMRLMIVDDELATRKVIRAFLDFHQLGIDPVLEAGSGQEAMELIHTSGAPEIVITDMQMPVVGGIQLLDYLSACHPETAIIVVSGFFDFPYTHAAIKSNAVDYILKPIDPDKLQNAVKICIQKIKRQQQAPSVALENKVILDQSTYQQILHAAEQMRKLLDYGNLESITHALSSLRQLAENSPHPKAATDFAIHLFANVLRYYYFTRSTEAPSDSATVQIDICQSFSDLTRFYETTFVSLREQTSSRSLDATLCEIRQWLERNYHLPIRLDELAASFFVSKEHMSACFHKKYGKTINEYLLQLRMEEAKLLLEHTTTSIGGIAKMVGYDDPAYFNRVFKKYTGISPGQYKKHDTSV